MIDVKIDLSHWSCKQLCQFHNHVKKSGVDNKDNTSKLMIIRHVKQTLIEKKICSKIVLNYKGKL